MDEKIIELKKEVRRLKQKIKSLESNEKKYRDLFNYMSCGVAVYKAVDNGKDFVFMDFNKTGENIDNIQKDNLIGKKVTSVFPAIRKFGLLEIFRRVWRTGIPEDHPVACYKDNRLDGWRENHVYKLPSGEIVAIYEDVTEKQLTLKALRERENLLQKISENLPNTYISIIEKDFTVGFATGGHFSKLNLDPQDFMGLHLKDIFGEHYPYVKEMYDGAFEGHETTFELYINNQFQSYNAVPLPDEDGKIERILALVHDITKIKKQEQEKQEMQRQIYHSSKLASIGEVAAGVAHEINNPLSIINGNLTLLSEEVRSPGLLPEKISDRLQKIKKSSSRIANIVTGLKRLSVTDSDSREMIDLKHIVKETLSLVTVLYEKDGITITEKYDRNDKFMILGNSGRFQQVLMNLLTNARDALKDRKNKHINIKIKSMSKNIKFEFSDTGCGMSQEVSKKIFKPFFTTKEIGTGVGLGMGVSRSIIESMRGTITIKSNPDKGSTFIITLPKAITRFKKSAKPTPDDLYKPLSGKALIVDDEEEIREVLSEFLVSFGIQVEEATDGVDALDKIESRHYDFIITDIKMPRMHGDKFLDHIEKKKLKNTRVFVITGQFSHNEAQNLKYINHPATHGFLEKPFSKNQVYLMLRGITRKNSGPN